MKTITGEALDREPQVGDVYLWRSGFAACDRRGNVWEDGAYGQRKGKLEAQSR